MSTPKRTTQAHNQATQAQDPSATQAQTRMSAGTQAQTRMSATVPVCLTVPNWIGACMSEAAAQGLWVWVRRVAGRGRHLVGPAMGWLLRSRRALLGGVSSYQHNGFGRHGERR